MDVMQLRRSLMMQKKTKRYQKFDIPTDNTQVVTDVLLPQDGWTVFLEIRNLDESQSAVGAYDIFQTTNAGFKIAHYNNYTYIDIGTGSGNRRSIYDSSGYLYESISRIVAVWDGTIGRVLMFDGDSNFWTSSRTFNSESAGAVKLGKVSSTIGAHFSFTVYLYRFALSDSDIRNFVKNGILY